MLAMHMANELLTRNVAGAFILVAGGGLVLAARAAQRSMDPFRVPLTGVLAAFVFAAQMINFPIPVGGTSGHLVGSVLLAILLGPHIATLAMASILIIQCLIFQDGGLLALGANIVNMGLLPCYLGYAIFRPLAGATPTPARLFLATMIATVSAVTTGAAMVPVQTALSGVLVVPFQSFLLLMIGLHLLVGLVEALITVAVIGYLVRVRPATLTLGRTDLQGAGGTVSATWVASSILVIALLVGGVGSLFASQLPDALDSVTGGHSERASAVKPSDDPAAETASHLQERTAPLPDYAVRGHDAWWSTSLSGIAGTLLTLGLVWIIARRVNRPPHRHASDTPPAHASSS